MMDAAPWALPRNTHLGAMTIVRRQGFSNDQWVTEGANLLQVRSRQRGHFEADPSQIVRDRLALRGTHLADGLGLDGGAARQLRLSVADRSSRPRSAADGRHETGLARRPARSSIVSTHDRAFDRRPVLQRGALPRRLASEAERGRARASAGNDYEIVLVNDGSRDGSWPMMQRLAADDPKLVAVNLSRNHGHQLALTAGLDLCRGDMVLIIDADLQDPPELLAEMLATMRSEQADVVYGVRRSRAGETAFKRATAHGFYRLLQERHRGRYPGRRRRFPADEPPRARRVDGDARAGAVHPRNGRLDRLQAGADPLQPRPALRRRDQISGAQDDPLRIRRDHRIFIGAVEARQSCRAVRCRWARC